MYLNIPIIIVLSTTSYIPLYNTIYPNTTPYTPIYPYTTPYTPIYPYTTPYTPIHHHTPLYITIHPYTSSYTPIDHLTVMYITVHPYSKPYIPLHHHTLFIHHHTPNALFFQIGSCTLICAIALTAGGFKNKSHSTASNYGNERFDLLHYWKGSWFQQGSIFVQILMN